MRVFVFLPPLRLVVSRLQQAEAHLVVLFLLPGGSLLVPAWIAVRRYRSRRQPLKREDAEIPGATALRRPTRWPMSRAVSASAPKALATLSSRQPTAPD